MTINSDSSDVDSEYYNHPVSDVYFKQFGIKDCDSASPWSVGMNVISVTLGVNIVSWPWYMAGSSLFVGIIIMAFSLILNYFTLMIIIHAAEENKIFNLGDLMAVIPSIGRPLRIVVNIVIWFVGLGYLIGFQIGLAEAMIILLPSTSRI
eukprot:UN23523